MKLRILSDLHLEFGPLVLPAAGEDVLVLAGDIGLHTQGLAWAEAASRRLGVPVVMVAGNHEFYQHPVVQERCTVRSTKAALSAVATGFPGRVHVLDASAAVIAGIRFLGGTLWTDFALAGDPLRSIAQAWSSMNDYHVIDWDEGIRFSPSHALDEHRRTLTFLSESFRQPFGGPTVVITHHAPSARSLEGSTRAGPLSPAYASNLDDFVAASGAALWVHGHLHHSVDYVIGATRVRSNPRGYCGIEENPRFDPGLVIDLGVAAPG